MNNEYFAAEIQLFQCNKMNNFNDENHFPSKTQCKGWYKLVLVEFEKNLQIKKKLWQQKEEFLK